MRKMMGEKQERRLRVVMLTTKTTRRIDIDAIRAYIVYYDR